MSDVSRLKRKLSKQVMYDLYRGRLPQTGKEGGNAGVGDTFYVNGSAGSDSNSGNSPRDAFATITYALTKCTDRNDDTILVCNRDTTEAAYPVSINKRDIHILAWDNPTRPGANKMYFSSGSAACFEVAAQNVEIAGFDFVATASYPAIQFANSSYWNCHVRDCNFGRRGALQDGILLGGVSRDAAYMTVTDCFFASGIARDGIRLEGAMTFGWIGQPGHGNVFNGVTSVGVNLTVASTLSGIIDNKFALTASFSAGDAITMAAGSTGALIDGNHAMEKVEDTWTNNPYLEGGSNHWGLNYKGIKAATLPA